MNQSFLSPLRLAGLQSSLDLGELARECGFSKRRGGKIDPETWLRSIFATSAMGKSTLGASALSIGLLSGRSVSKQAVHGRVDDTAIDFLAAILARSLGSKLEKPLERMRGFERLLVEDSTSVALPGSLRAAFPGSVNGSGSSSTLKIHGVFELISRRFVDFRMEPYLSPDQKSSPKIASTIGRNDLVVRDLGYFNLRGFEAIAQAGACYLSRLQSQCVLRSLGGKRIDLLDTLRKEGGMDREVLLGNALHRCRVVAFRAPRQVGDSRRRELRRAGRKENSLLFDLQDWTLYATNAGAARLPASGIEAIYRQRWTIEILFKSWKSGLSLASIHPRASRRMALCSVLATLILSTLAQSKILPAIEARTGGRTSPIKLASTLSLVLVLCALGSSDRSSIIENLARHALYEKRKKPNLRQDLELMLT